MSPLSLTRKDAEAFARAVDGVGEQGSERFDELLSCVESMRGQDVPAPRPDFVADLRMRLMDAADTLLLPAEPLAPVVDLQTSAAIRRQRRVSIAAAAFVVVGGTAGVAAAAEKALPGDALYPLKRGIESAQVTLSASDSGRGQDLLRRASTRLDEVDGLLSKGEDTALINQTLASFQESAASGADLIFTQYQRDSDTEDISSLRAMIGSQLAKLDSMDPLAPQASRTAFANARDLLGQLDQQASVLCGNCGPAGMADRFAASSAPSLASLLTTTAAVAQGGDQADRNNDLADKADEIARNSTPPVEQPDPVPPASPTTDPTSGLPLPVAEPDALVNPLGGLTSGVAALLKEVGGEPLTGVVDRLTGGLLQ